MSRLNKWPIGWLIVSCATIFVIIGGWQLLQPRGNAPDFSLTDVEGNTFRLTGFRGEVVLLDFMATWCGPCRISTPQLKRMWDEYGPRIVIISISVDPTYDTIQALTGWASIHNATWIHARDTSVPPVTQLYRIQDIPTFVIIDKKGDIRYTQVGVTEGWEETISGEIARLLEE